MTFILAANLSDRILLATDTVATKKNPDGTREVVCYYPKLQHFSNGKPGDQFLACLFAGDLEFAKFLSGVLTSAIDAKTLPADIVLLHAALPDFLAVTVPKFSGLKRATFILAGTSYDGSLRTINFDHISRLLGGSAGHIDDPVLVQAMQMASRIGGLEKWKGKVPVILPRQEIFQVKIDEGRSLLDVSDLHGSYSLLTAGTKSLTPAEQDVILRHFLDNRDIENEGKDLVNFMRNQFSDSIGGAVMLGVMDANVKRGALTYVTYDIARDSTKPLPLNWSFEIDAKSMYAVDPQGVSHDLLTSHYGKGSESGGLDL
jgi:hypothetical protein